MFVVNFGYRASGFLGSSLTEALCSGIHGSMFSAQKQ